MRMGEETAAAVFGLTGIDFTEEAGAAWCSPVPNPAAAPQF